MVSGVNGAGALAWTTTEKDGKLVSKSDAMTAISMRGAGYYSSNTAGAKAVIDRAGDLAADALGRMAPQRIGSPFSIADFGAADGGTSLDLMRRLIGQLRSRDASREITLTYTDLPHNDFCSLFRLTQGLLDGQTGTPLTDTEGLFIFGSGTSFYQQIVPTETLSFGFSATAMHWLSDRPCMIKDHVQAVGAAVHERDLFRARALSDWQNILLARARELRPGGKLVLANFCIDEGGRYLGATGGVIMFDRFARHWRDLVVAGRINETEYVNATFQQFYKTVDEFVAPFNDRQSPVAQAGLTLNHLSTMVTGCPYAEAFGRRGDAVEFARAYVPTLRSWSETVFAGALDKSRSLPERAAIIDDFYGAYQDEVARAPEGHAMDYVHCLLEITKVAPRVS